MVVAPRVPGELRREFGVRLGWLGPWVRQNSALASPSGGRAHGVEAGHGNMPLHTPLPGGVLEMWEVGSIRGPSEGKARKAVKCRLRRSFMRG